MVHRGPDDAGMASNGPATIGMRRLAIFDPNNGHQPMATPDGRYSIVFNGAIYNFRDLQADLEALGWAFRTRCDTEVLLAALAQWGQDAVKKLRGMFAFGLWDAAENSLLLARDPFGIKPLYFRVEGGQIVFASELGALLATSLFPAEIDPHSVSEYLSWLSVPAPKTIYKGVWSLQPGECLRFTAGSHSIQRQWSLKSAASIETPCESREEFVAALRGRLEDTIRAHVIADVPVGAFLSGGLDSAVVAALMSREGGNALKTFSIGFEEAGYSEADEAQATARHLGAIHHTRILTGGEMAEDIDKLMSAFDQPTGDGINTYYVSETAQQGGVKVALSGLGGDELFGGYPSFRSLPLLSRHAAVWSKLPRQVRSLAAAVLGSGGARARKLADMIQSANGPHELASLQRRVFSEASRISILAPDAAALAPAGSPFHPRLGALREELDGLDLFSLASGWELRTYMSDVLLRDSDVISMRHSIELRVPFIDRPLIEWLWRQPSKFKFDRSQPKSALFDATRDLLPPGLMKRRKWGFSFPFPIWMRSHLRPFIEDTLSSGSIGKSGFFSAEPVQRLWRGFLAGGDDREWSRVWSLVVLVAFVNRTHTPDNSGLVPINRNT